MLFVGRTRFSLLKPNSGDWVASSNRSYGEYKNYLYSDSRLDFRSEVFLEMSCPQLELASRDHKLFHIVSYSDSLPFKYKQLLQHAAQKWDFLILDEQKTESEPFNVTNLIREHLTDTRIFGLYRIDDDDVLAADYFDSAANYLKPEFAGMQISLARGLTGVWESGKVSPLREMRSPLVSAGLMDICRLNEDGSLTAPRSTAHDQADRVNPVILDSKPLSYLQLRHLGQDTSLKITEKEVLSRLRRSVLGFPEIENIPEAERNFQTIVDRLSFHTEFPLLESQIPLGQNHSLAFPKPLHHFSLAVGILAGQTAELLNVVVSFDLIYLDGSPVSYDEEIEGIAKSNDRSLGFYYIPRITPGHNQTRATITLPSNILCKGIRFTRRPQNEAQILITNCTITS